MQINQKYQEIQLTMGDAWKHLNFIEQKLKRFILFVRAGLGLKNYLNQV